LAQVEQALPHIRFKHISATSGYAYQGQINANVARVGIGLYGIAPFLPISLTPALELATSIVEIKTIQVGDTVGYNNTFTAHGPMRLGVLPLGYYEGIDLRLSNRGSVKIKGRVCPIIGRVSMNLTSVDITNIPDVAVGEPVTVISSTVGDPNSIQKLAEMCGTIAYEPLVHIPQHLRRKIV
jgi:alanine racemase